MSEGLIRLLQRATKPATLEVVVFSIKVGISSKYIDEVYWYKYNGEEKEREIGWDREEDHRLPFNNSSNSASSLANASASEAVTTGDFREFWTTLGTEVKEMDGDEGATAEEAVGCCW